MINTQKLNEYTCLPGCQHPGTYLFHIMVMICVWKIEIGNIFIQGLWNLKANTTMLIVYILPQALEVLKNVYFQMSKEI